MLGYRDRDRRAGFLLPHMGNFADVPATHGRAALDAPALLHAPGMEPTLVWADLATIRSWTSLPLVLKGIMTAEDARLAVEHGVDAIVVSNHGARQLDRVPATVDVLAEVVGAVGGRAEVWVDGGIRRGLDIAIARRSAPRACSSAGRSIGRWPPAAPPASSARSRSCARSSRWRSLSSGRRHRPTSAVRTSSADRVLGEAVAA